MAFSLSRLTAYAVISSIEEDLRIFIDSKFSHLSAKELFGLDVWKKADNRISNDFGLLDTVPSLDMLLYYVDFGDLFQTINNHRLELGNKTSEYFRAQTNLFEKMLSIRNRVAHSRPLHFDDLPTTLDIANNLLADREIEWDNLRKAFREL